MADKYPSKKWLYEEYIVKDRFIRDISNELKVDYFSLRGHLAYIGITKRNHYAKCRFCGRKYLRKKGHQRNCSDECRENFHINLYKKKRIIDFFGMEIKPYIYNNNISSNGLVLKNTTILKKFIGSRKLIYLYRQTTGLQIEFKVQIIKNQEELWFKSHTYAKAEKIFNKLKLCTIYDLKAFIW